MVGIAVEIVIDAPSSFVWQELAVLSTHVEWMRDAESIRFLGDQTSGVGTRFECETRVGPFTTTDLMEITEWRAGQAMGVRHEGLVTGSGRFTLTPSGSATVFAWAEQLDFPPKIGGPITARLAKPVLRTIWRSNLRLLKARVESAWACRPRGER